MVGCEGLKMDFELSVQANRVCRVMSILRSLSHSCPFPSQFDCCNNNNLDVLYWPSVTADVWKHFFSFLPLLLQLLLFLSSSSALLCWPTLSAHRQFSFRHRFYGRSTADRQMLHSDMEICLKKKQRQRRKERTMKDKRNHNTLTRPVLERKSEREEFPNLVHTCWTRGSLSAPSNCSTRSTTTGCLLNSFSLSVPLRGTRRENERLLFTIFLLDDVIANVTAETGILWGYNTWTWSVGSDWTTGALNSCLHKNTTDGLEKTIESKQTAINY